MFNPWANWPFTVAQAIKPLKKLNTNIFPDSESEGEYDEWEEEEEQEMSYEHSEGEEPIGRRRLGSDDF